MLNDLLAQTLSALRNAEVRSKEEITVRPTSKVVHCVLEILKKNGYVTDFEHFQDSKGGSVRIKLAKKINSIGVIKPRFSVKIDEYKKFEKRYLPARNFGIIIVSTPQGMMTHQEAKEKKQGGKLIAYAY